MRILISLAILLALFSVCASAQNGSPLAPGTPCPNGGPCDQTGNPIITVPSAPLGVDPEFVLNDPSVTPLLLATGAPVFVVPGDVVVCEFAGCALTSPMTQWSDVIEFTNGANGSTATVFPDLENGVIGFAGPLSGNAVTLDESVTANVTDYVAGTNTYHLLSDSAAQPEPPEPTETPEPSTIMLLLAGSFALVADRRRR